MHPMGYSQVMTTTTLPTSATAVPSPGQQLDMFAEAARDERETAERTTGVPRLYALRCTTIADYQHAMTQWSQAWPDLACLRDSHGWHVAIGEYASSREPTSACIPITLQTDLRCNRTSHRGCLCVGDLVSRSFCRGCGWHSEVVDDDTDAALLGLDHCFPGWRDDPIVPSAPYDDGPKRRTRRNWETTVTELHGTDRPQGYPMITRRGPHGWRAVPGRSLWGGYDVAAETLGR